MCTDILLIWMAAARAIAQTLVVCGAAQQSAHTQNCVKEMKHHHFVWGKWLKTKHFFATRIF